MNAAEFYRTIKQHIEEAVAKRAPYRAKVSAINEGLVQIQTYDSSTPMLENYSQLAGLKVNPGDEVAVIELGGKPFILGRVKRDLSTKNRFEGAYVIESAASDAFTVVNRNTDEEVFRLNATTKDMVVGGGLYLGGTTTNKIGDTEIQPIYTWTTAAPAATVTSTTSTTAFVDAISYSWNLGAGTWQLQCLGSVNLIHNANGGVIVQVEVNGVASTSASSVAYSGSYTTVSSVYRGNVTTTGTIAFTVQYRATTAGTVSARNPMMFLSARRMP